MQLDNVIEVIQGTIETIELPEQVRVQQFTRVCMSVLYAIELPEQVHLSTMDSDE
jgi:hypothetical protein